MIRARRAASLTGRLLVSLLILLVYFVPFYWMALTAIKSNGEMLKFPPTFWTAHPSWDNFAVAFGAFPFWKYLWNSILVSGSIILCQVFTVVPAAYAFARYRFKGSGVFFGLTLASVMIPPQLVFLPVFLLMNRFGLINRYASLILPQAASAFGIFMLRQTFRQVPEEILEAARMDKASELSIIARIMIPIAMPTISALSLITFIGTWNDYFWPLVLTTNEAVRTLPVGVASLKLLDGGISIPYNVVMAGNLILIVPVLLIYLIAQQRITKAFTYMGEK
ncbi:MAG TPA: carbohydrate ABC transporter permease [Rectinemataceae bacterium]|nr:carbohydrate ABC transporter permease [Rectinemataceae bacterium]